jgi:hypothetical protein
VRRDGVADGIEPATTGSIIHTHRHIIEHVDRVDDICPPMAPMPEPTAALIEPAPTTASTAPLLRDSEAPAQRAIHIRIGSIEIHSEERAPATAAPVTQPSAAPAASRGGGFDQFARLRRYTPWQW